jgi:2-polyprenyl-3-methyl-5-hydroxy-6-metoxy-1,4-benzoquinol methylase
VSSFNCVVCSSDAHHFLYPLTDVSFDHPGEWDFVECQDCGHGCIYPSPPEEELQQLYETLYTEEKGEEMIKIGRSRFDIGLQKNRVRLLAKHCSAPKAVLDAGCGMGFSLKRVAEQFPDAHCLGVELSQQAADHAMQLGGMTIMRKNFHLVEEEQDLIMMNHILEHLVNPNEAIAHAHKCLRGSGVLLVEVPIGSGWTRRMWKKYWWCHLPPQHLHLFSPEGLSRIITAQGFTELERSRTGYPFGFSMGWIVYVRAAWGSYSSYRKNRAVRVPAFILGLLVLPLCLVLDLLVAPILNFTQGDIVTMVFKKEGKA